MLKQLKLILLCIGVTYCAVYPFLNRQSQKPTTEASEPLVEIKVAENTTQATEVDLVEVEYASEHLPDFSKYTDVKQKKRAFFGYLAPLVRQINREMLNYRTFVDSLKSAPISEKEQNTFLKIANKFHINTDQSFESIRAQMLLRVDALPVELVLMQAANESGWGTSRFALVANNLFGQWCFKPGCGVVPTGRPAGEKYEVRQFAHPIDSIRSYYNNLNTGHAYAELRNIRLQLRQARASLNPSKIAEGLLAYSIRREAYIEEIQTMIRINTKYIPEVTG